MEDYGNDRYEVRVDGTGRVTYVITSRNRRFLRAFDPDVVKFDPYKTIIPFHCHTPTSSHQHQPTEKTLAHHEEGTQEQLIQLPEEGVNKSAAVASRSGEAVSIAQQDETSQSPGRERSTQNPGARDLTLWLFTVKNPAFTGHSDKTSLYW